MKFLIFVGLAALLLTSSLSNFIALANEDAVSGLKLPILDPACSAPIVNMHLVVRGKDISTTKAMATVSSPSFLPSNKGEMKRLCCKLTEPHGGCKSFAPCPGFEPIVPTFISSRAEEVGWRIKVVDGLCCFGRGRCGPCPPKNANISTQYPVSSSTRLRTPRIFVLLGMVQKTLTQTFQQCTNCQDPLCNCAVLEPSNNTTRPPATVPSSSNRLRVPGIFVFLGMVQNSLAQTFQQCTNCQDPLCLCPILEPPNNTTVSYIVRSGSTRLRVPGVFAFFGMVQNTLAQHFTLCTDCRDPFCICPYPEPPYNTTVPYIVRSGSTHLRVPGVFAFFGMVQKTFAHLGMLEETFEQTVQQCTHCQGPTCVCPVLQTPHNTTVPYALHSVSIRLGISCFYVLLLEEIRTSLSQIFFRHLGTN